jgi:hypothetical protein
MTVAIASERGVREDFKGDLDKKEAMEEGLQLGGAAQLRTG